MVIGPLCGESTNRWIPLIKASAAELWGFLWSAPNKRLSKQSRRRWFETPSRLLWRHCIGRFGWWWTVLQLCTILPFSVIRNPTIWLAGDRIRSSGLHIMVEQMIAFEDYSLQFNFQFITSLLLYFTKICIHKLISMIQLNIVIQSAYTSICDTRHQMHNNSVGNLINISCISYTISYKIKYSNGSKKPMRVMGSRSVTVLGSNNFWLLLSYLRPVKLYLQYMRYGLSNLICYQW